MPINVNASAYSFPKLTTSFDDAFAGFSGTGVNGILPDTGPIAIPEGTVGTGIPSVGGIKAPGGGFSLSDPNSMRTLQLGLQGFNSLLGGYFGLQQLGLAKKQYKLAKDTTETNLANQIKSYNTTLADRARARGFTEGQSDAQIQSYIDQNSVSRKPKM